MEKFGKANAMKYPQNHKVYISGINYRLMALGRFKKKYNLQALQMALQMALQI